MATAQYSSKTTHFACSVHAVIGVPGLLNPSTVVAVWVMLSEVVRLLDMVLLGVPDHPLRSQAG